MVSFLANDGSCFHVTLSGTNIFAPENGWFEYEAVSFWAPAYFQGRLLLVSGRVPFATCENSSQKPVHSMEATLTSGLHPFGKMIKFVINLCLKIWVHEKTYNEYD